MTKLFQVLIPTHSNAGVSTRPEREKWEIYLRNTFNGFTRGVPCTGCWYDQGLTYWDEVIPYTIASEQGATEALGRMALELFSDQAAVFVAEIGTAQIVFRSTPTVQDLLREATA